VFYVTIYLKSQVECNKIVSKIVSNNRYGVTSFDF